MPVEPLNLIQATSIVKEIHTSGHSPLLVTASDFNLYVAKNDKGQSPSLHLINEVLATYFLNQWQLPVPECAIVEMDLGLLENQQLSNYHRTLNYQRPCFGSKWIDNAIDVNSFLTINDRKAYNKIQNPIDFLRFALFDEWLANDDRKPTNYNLIIEPVAGKYKITAIDHAFIFESPFAVARLLYRPIHHKGLLVFR